jgi:hypothetical protein
MFNFTYSRKILIFGLSIGVLVSCSLFMPIDFFAIVSEKVVYIAVGFFAGNSIEHMAGMFKK